MPIFGTGPRRTDGRTNPLINATLTYLTPTQVPNLTVWFDAADTSTITTNISSLNQWFSKTPIPYVMSNTYGLQGPVWVSTTQNGLGVMRFRANNSSFMSTSQWYNTSNFVTNNETTMLLAYNPTNNGAPFGVQDSQYGNNLRIFPQSGQNWFCGSIYNLPNNGRIDYSYPVATGFKVESYFGRQSTLGARMNGSLFAQSTMGTGLSFPAGVDKFVQMGAQSYGSRFFTQDIGEALIYNRGLSDFELQGVEAYLARKWGTQSALPYRHPGVRTGPPLMGYRLITYPRLVSNYGLWYDAMDTSTIRDVGGNFPPLLPPNALGVGQWNDKSGNNRHLSNFITNPSQFNLMSPGTFYPVVYANDGGSRLRLQTTPSAFTGSSISAFFVLSLPTTSYVPAFNYTSSFDAMPIPINSSGPNPSTFDFSLRYLSNTIGFSRHGAVNNTNRAINVISAPFTINTNTLVSIFVNASGTTLGNVLPSTNLISINGAFVSSSTTYAGNPFNFQYLSMFSGYNFSYSVPSFFNEVAFFYRTLTTPERLLIENQLIRKWQLPSNAPVSYINALSVTSGLFTWIDAYSASNISTTVSSDGLTRVDTAFDRSGNGRNFKVVTGWSNVFYNRVSTMNQFNSLYFSTGTVGGILSNDVPINSFSTNSYSFFMVYNQLSTNATARLISANNQANSDSAVGGVSYQFINQSPFLVTKDYQSAGANIVNGTNYLTSVIVNGGPTYETFLTSTFSVYTNSGTGAALTSAINNASTNLLNLSQINIGGRATATNFAFNGLISEVILYNRPLSNAERQTIETYLLNKWNISTLISNVPVTRGLNLWLDAYDPATVIFSTNTNLVRQWRDKSISTLHFSNALTDAASKPPLYTTNPANNLPGLFFSNSAPTTSFYTSIYNCNFNYPRTTEATLFVTYANAPSAGFYGPLFTVLSNAEIFYNSANGFGLEITNSDNSISVLRSSVRIYSSGIPNTVNTTTLATVVFNSSFSTTLIADIPQNHYGVGRNGMIGITQISSFISTNSNLTVSTLNFTVNQAVLGTRGAGTTGDAQWYYAGYIHEVLLYNRTLSFVERQQVESYLISKWYI